MVQDSIPSERFQLLVLDTSSRTAIFCICCLIITVIYQLKYLNIWREKKVSNVGTFCWRWHDTLNWRHFCKPKKWIFQVTWSSFHISPFLSNAFHLLELHNEVLGSYWKKPVLRASIIGEIRCVWWVLYMGEKNSLSVPETMISDKEQPGEIYSRGMHDMMMWHKSCSNISYKEQ